MSAFKCKKCKYQTFNINCPLCGKLNCIKPL